MVRRLLDPNSLPPEPSDRELRRSLVDIWYLVSEGPITATADYTTTGNVALEVVVCTNTDPTAVTVSLHATPADGDEVIVNRHGTGAVTVDTAGTETIISETSCVIVAQYDSPHFLYSEAAGEWVLV